MSENQQDARHEASPAQLIQARQQGDAARSQELATSIQLFVGVLAAYFLVQSLVVQFSRLASESWSSELAHYSTDSFYQQISGSLWSIGFAVLPLLVIVMLIGLFSHIVQNTTLTFFSRPLIDVTRMNPANSFKRNFGWPNLVRALAGVPKLVILLTVSCLVAWQVRDQFVELPMLATKDMFESLVKAVFTVLISFTGTMLILSGFDFAIERFSFVQRNRMTDQQLRDETRRQESDPQIGQRRQQFHRDLM